MTSVERAIAFTHLVARLEPTPGLRDDRRVINVARIVSRALEADGHAADRALSPLLLPATASGIPIIKRPV